jgi:hypothetical protein
MMECGQASVVNEFEVVPYCEQEKPTLLAVSSLRDYAERSTETVEGEQCSALCLALQVSEVTMFSRSAAFMKRRLQSASQDILRGKNGIKLIK